jgi:DNA polymerase III subunit alpha
MSKAGFVHLHVHTHYSFLDSTIRICDLIGKTKEYDMPAVAITNHGNLCGAIEFYEEAKRNNVKPIIGCELYVAPQKRFDKGSTTGEKSDNIIVLAENNKGYKNLLKLSSAGYLEGFNNYPRVDKELLARYHEGLIALSGGLDGEIAKLIAMDKKDVAREVIKEYKSIFGNGHFYLEIMDNGLPQQQTVNKSLIEFGKELGIPLVATNDCHYLNREDAEAHKVLRSMKKGKAVGEDTKFKTAELYFRSPAEMQKLFSYCPEAVRNTITAAERCNVELKFDKFFLPDFEYNQEETPDERLTKDAFTGLQNFLPAITKGKNKSALAQKYRQRLKEELEIIKDAGVADYFLVVANFVQYAKKNHIPVGPGRGSATGSLLNYTLGITSIDPVRYGLIFERFLNPGRISLPDIDIDFCEEGRDEVIKYVTSKYGKEKVAGIITFGKMTAKALVRDVGRAINIPHEEMNRISKLVPNQLFITVEEAVKMKPRLQIEENNNPQIKNLLSISRSLEGLVRHTSQHATGIVISDIPLVEHVPLMMNPKVNTIVTQFSMNDLLAIGLTKFDFLGLKTLTIIRNAVNLIKINRAIEIDINNLPLDDRPTFELLSSGNTEGVFQLESSGMKDIIAKMKPDCIENICALIALYRPGPVKLIPEFIARKQGKTKITYLAPTLRQILKGTYGLIIYQEQLMQIAGKIGNFTMVEADTLRRVINFQKAMEIEKGKIKFLQGAKANKISESKAQMIWDEMVNYGGFDLVNKAHSIAYAMITYQTAYLKAHYPAEFMTAQLNSSKGKVGQ